MSEDVSTSIADATAPQAEARLRRWVLVGATLIGLSAALYYAWQDLTLSHYDARGHLMVARRVIDNLTPGWIQLGAVWLPLPHLLNMLPAQWDWSYQTGAVATLLSVLAQSLGLAALAGFLLRRTQAPLVAAAVPLLILINPDVLYLQSTPMTEPLLFGLSLLALDLVSQWMDRCAAGVAPAAWKPGFALAGLVLTRYEGWCIAGALLGLVALSSPRRALGLARYPVAAIIGFLFLSKGATGVWFVTSGFFEANNPALGHPLTAIGQVIGGASRLGGTWLLVVGLLGLLACLAAALTARKGAGHRMAMTQALLPMTLLAAAALPVYAFSNGHPFRIRYMVAVVVTAAVLSAFALARVPTRVRPLAVALCLALSLWGTPPLDGNAPMVREAQWDRPHAEARRAVTDTLTRIWDHTPIMASMGSLGHYMQQMSRDGFRLRDFLHEGNGDLWKSAFRTPERYVHWILIEESAEGGDMLAQRAREDAAFLAGFDRVAEGGGVALYQRRAPRPQSAPFQ